MVCKNGDLEEVKRLIKNGFDDWNLGLYDACRGGHSNIINLMIEKGALSVRAICTHPILSGEVYEKIENSKLSELIVTDSIPLKKKSDKIRVLSCAPLFAEVMHMVHHNNSISGKFIM